MRTITIIFSLFALSAYTQIKGNPEIDTSIVLGASHYETLKIDSANFLYLSIAFDPKIITSPNYNTDSIMHYQDLLFQRLELSNIDTLFIEGFLEKCDASNILSGLKNVNVLYLYGYGCLQVMSKESNKGNQIGVVQIASTNCIEVDLAVFESLKTKTLLLDVTEEYQINKISIKNTSQYLEQLIFEKYYFPKFKKFVRKNKLESINEHIEITQSVLTYRRLKVRNAPSPHGGRI